MTPRCVHYWKLRPPDQGMVSGLCIRCASLYRRPDPVLDTRDYFNGAQQEYRSPVTFRPDGMRQQAAG